jgi:hypothetical protein
MRTKQVVAALLAAGAVFCVHAHDLSIDECTEAGDFIRNAALSRDSGITRADFIGRMHGDFQAIRAFPPELRWFVQDEDDEGFLLTHAERVFDDPGVPESHESDFLQACFERIGEQARAREEKIRAAQAGSE